jgi:hypothetical protein
MKVVGNDVQLQLIADKVHLLVAYVTASFSIQERSTI